MIDKPHSTSTIGCVEISIDNDATRWWSAQQVYDYLVPEAQNLDLLTQGRGELFLEVRSDTTYHYTSGNYSQLLPMGCNVDPSATNCTYVIVITLIADPIRHQFIAPGFEPAGYEHYAEATIAHEYGHAWTFYYRSFFHQQSWADYVAERGLTGSSDPVNEVIAEDYRMCFGSYWAVNAVDRSYPDVGKPTPEDCNWLATVWRPA